ETEPGELFEQAFGRGDLESVKDLVRFRFEKVRAYALLRLSQEYLIAATSGDRAGAERQLSKLKLIGELAAETLGDPSLTDLYNTFSALRSEERAPALALLRDYSDAVAKIQAAKHAEALPILERIALEFQRRGCDLLYAAVWFNKLNIYYYYERIEDALKAMEPLLSLVQSKGWRYELGRYLALRAVLYSTQGEITKALISSELALPVVYALPDLLAKTYQFQGLTYWKVGNLTTSLTYFHRSVDTLLRSGTGPAGSRQYLSDLSYNYLNVADIHRLKGNHHLALLYAKQAVSASEPIGPNQSACEALSLMGLQYAYFGKFDDATASFDASKDILAQLPANRRVFPTTLLALRRGKVALLQGELDRALESFTEAVRITAADKNHRDLQIKALGGRAKALVKARRPQEAKADLAAAVKLVEEIRNNIQSREDKSSFFDTGQAVFDERISLELDLFANKEAAFEASEQSRARTLLEDLNARKPVPLAEVIDTLSPDQTVISYAVTDERTHIFVIGRDQFEARSVELSSGKLDIMVKDYLADLKGQADIEIVNRKGRELYRQLFLPVAGLVKSGQKLCIVPDKAIHYLPLGALVDEQGRFLIQSFSISYAQSGSVLARCIRTSREKPSTGSESMLAVANPLFDESRFSDLERLPDAVLESSNSIKFYNADSVVLKEAEATEANVRARLRDYDVAHLALHSLVDEGSGWLAALVLASSGQQQFDKGDGEPSEKRDAPRAIAAAYTQAATRDANDGLLYLQELYNLGLPRTRLVVLSACESGVGQYYQGEGMVSLASPFLAAQVPTVVVSLWKVDSESAAKLMVDFHYERKVNGLGVGDALRAAQVKMIETGGSYQHPYRWAPFITIGSAD
ncbi:MAG TPA: CHAT domain-containing protein, partial [Blastocatellia bacterium]|nr:CHAT domain-containing protein [Blastocatellia bacterium]